MSLILEALRKSEAERRRGLPPDLHAELPPAATARVHPLPPWAWALVAAAATAAAIWWWRHDRVPAATANAPDTVTGERRPAVEPAPVQTALPARTRQPAPLPSTPAPVVAAPAPPVAMDAPASTPPSPAPREPLPAPAADPSPLPVPAPGRVLAIADLDPASRKALPPLRLSMHLWNEDPAQRFVIIDGQRLREGDRVGEATISRIEPDGVLLAWRGGDVRLPLR